MCTVVTLPHEIMFGVVSQTQLWSDMNRVSVTEKYLNHSQTCIGLQRPGLPHWSVCHHQSSDTALPVGFSRIVCFDSVVISQDQMMLNLCGAWVQSLLSPSVHPPVYLSIPMAYKLRSSIPPLPSVKASALWRAAAIVVSDKASLSVE